MFSTVSRPTVEPTQIPGAPSPRVKQSWHEGEHVFIARCLYKQENSVTCLRLYLKEYNPAMNTENCVSWPFTPFNSVLHTLKAAVE
jgi:hypothetical protein